jgi:RNA ligase (TIGR02306 family)
MRRKLASVQKIIDIKPIPDADAIEVATVLGWHCVIRKDEGFKPDDTCVYFEVDSLLDRNNPRFTSFEKNNFRIRTIKLRGQVSQGLVMPMDILPPGQYGVGDDVTEILNIVKYEPPIPACISGVVRGAFPSYIPKTDETRVQILQDVLDRWKGIEVVCTEKLDGSSMTAFYTNSHEDEPRFGVCSRNLELKEDDQNTLWKVARQNNLESVLREEKSNLAIQGEIIGNGINKNRYQITGQNIYIFNIFDIINYRFYTHEELRTFCEIYHLNMVPEVGRVTLVNDIDQIVEMAKGKSVLNPKIPREGIVLRPLTEEKDPDIGRLSFKVINPDYLLKYD